MMRASERRPWQPGEWRPWRAWRASAHRTAACRPPTPRPGEAHRAMAAGCRLPTRRRGDRRRRASAVQATCRAARAASGTASTVIISAASTGLPGGADRRPSRRSRPRGPRPCRRTRAAGPPRTGRVPGAGQLPPRGRADAPDRGEVGRLHAETARQSRPAPACGEMAVHHGRRTCKAQHQTVAKLASAGSSGRAKRRRGRRDRRFTENPPGRESTATAPVGGARLVDLTCVRLARNCPSLQAGRLDAPGDPPLASDL